MDRIRMLNIYQYLYTDIYFFTFEILVHIDYNIYSKNWKFMRRVFKWLDLRYREIYITEKDP